MSSRLPVGHVVTRLRVLDRDLEKNGHVTYAITSAGSDKLRFKVDGELGHVIVAHALTDIDHRWFRLDVTATDHGVPPR